VWHPYCFVFVHVIVTAPRPVTVSVVNDKAWRWGASYCRAKKVAFVLLPGPERAGPAGGRRAGNGTRLCTQTHPKGGS